MTCPGCNKPLKERDNDTRNIWYNDALWHRGCAYTDSGEFTMIQRVFEFQDDWDIDPTTAMADMIGQVGHWCEAHNKGKRAGKRIDFQDAVRRGVNYWLEETGQG